MQQLDTSCIGRSCLLLLLLFNDSFRCFVGGNLMGIKHWQNSTDRQKTEGLRRKGARFHTLYHKITHSYAFRSCFKTPLFVCLFVCLFLSFCFFLSGNNNEVLTSRYYKDILFILVGRALELAICTKPETVQYQNFNSI